MSEETLAFQAMVKSHHRDRIYLEGTSLRKIVLLLVL